jgi:biopolymer transport protein ExbD
MKRFVNVRAANMRKARIEIIPMIDTIFFLLVFFMITSLSMVQMKGMGVSMPKDSNAVTKPPPKAIVTVNAAGQYYLDTTPTPQDQLQAALQSRVTKQPDTVIIVNVAGAQPVQTMINVMDIVNHVNTPSGDPVPVMIASQPVNPNGTAVDQTAPASSAVTVTQ